MLKSALPLAAILLLLGACGILETPAEPDRPLIPPEPLPEEVEESVSEDAPDQEEEGAPEPAKESSEEAAEPEEEAETEEKQPPAMLKSKEISYTSGGWTIHGTLYEAQIQVPTRTIMLVHGLEEDRGAWPASFIEGLHNEFPEALILAIDLRGHGKSTNLGTWHELDTAGFRDMRSEVVSADKYIASNYPMAKEYHVVGAGIGSTACILASQQSNRITRVVMISPGMEYQGVSIERAAKDYIHDVLAVASKGDAYSAGAVSSIAGLRYDTETAIYDGSAHGTGMFALTQGLPEPLERRIIRFLE